MSPKPYVYLPADVDECNTSTLTGPHRSEVALHHKIVIYLLYHYNYLNLSYLPGYSCVETEISLTRAELMKMILESAKTEICVEEEKKKTED